MSSWIDEINTYIRGAVSRHLTESSPQADQPSWIRQALRPHQLTLLAAAHKLESMAAIPTIKNGESTLTTSYGILADRVGAGKSLVALALVREPPIQQSQLKIKESGWASLISVNNVPACDTWNPDWIDCSGGLPFQTQMVNQNHRAWYTRTALMIVPHNTITQWEEYVTDQTDLKVVFIKKTKDCNFEADGWLRNVLNADLVIVSCTMLKKFVGAVGVNGPRFNEIVWSRFFLDEADSIACTLRPGDVHARFFWFITGSWLNMAFPNGLYSHSVSVLQPDIRSLVGEGAIRGIASRLNIVSHAISDSRTEAFTDLILRNHDGWIDKSLLRPTIIHSTLICKAPANLSVLKDFISSSAMEALHAGDIGSALTAMGLEANSKETIAARVTASLRGELTQAEKILAFKKDIDFATPAAKVEAIKKAEARVTRLQDQLTDLEGRLAGIMGDGSDSGSDSTMCPICYDMPRCATLTPCCRQTFCLACICECISKKPVCPLCRTQIATPKELMVVGEHTPVQSAKGEAAGPPTKGAALLKLLSESTGDQRFLVFSAHEASFRGLREILMARDIRCEVLQGTAARVDRLRAQFRDGTVRVLCMNARHVGAGINLEAATHVVLYHRMNVEMEKQVIGRAIRFERQEELQVVHLVHEQETAFNGAQESEVIMYV